MCFGGFFVNLDRISPAFSNIQFISWHRYAFEIHMINKWDHDGNHTISHCIEPLNETLTTISTTTHLPEEGICDWGRTGNEVLEFFHFDSVYMLRNFGVLIFYDNFIPNYCSFCAIY
uniref:Tyrosinase copper-binding domain-containing protein n=1 Tax=Panagrolaimus superbus TaxID=310955 RepID=A0A914YQZ3_9BILA